MICPTGAISCDWEQFHRDFNEKIGGILDGNLLANAAEECIASGKLRMLISKEEVRWDRPYLKAHPKRPRFRIPKERNDE
jgi:hypothetical protein